MQNGRLNAEFTLLSQNSQKHFLVVMHIHTFKVE